MKRWYLLYLLQLRSANRGMVDVLLEIVDVRMAQGQKPLYTDIIRGCTIRRPLVCHFDFDSGEPSQVS